MNIKTLRLFLHLCDSLNFSHTAKAMHISPSALSRQIKQFEEELGEVLFVRDNRRVELTPTGIALQPVALRIHNEWLQFRAQILDKTKELKGSVRLFCSVTASYSHLPELLNNFRHAYPAIEFKLLTGDPAQAISVIQNDEADIAIAAQPEQLPPHIEFKTISEISLSFIAPIGHPQLIEAIKQPQPDWNQLPFVLPESGTTRERANAWFKKMNIKPSIYAQISGHEAIVSLVALGCGLGIAPDVVINNSPVKDKIQRLDFLPISPFQLAVCCQHSKLNDPLVNALWQVIEPRFV